MLTRRLLALSQLASFAATARDALADFKGSPLDDFRRAEEFFRDDRFDPAIYWYYRATYRMTAHLAARPETPAKDGADVVWKFDRESGDLLRKIAHGDLRKLVRVMDRVLAESRTQDDAYTPRAQFPQAHAKAYAELREMRDATWKNRWRIRNERERDGLVNK